MKVLEVAVPYNPFTPELSGATISPEPIRTAQDLVKRFGEPNWGPNGKAVYERTYSRKKFTEKQLADQAEAFGGENITVGDAAFMSILADRNQETWSDTVLRVVDGNLGYADTSLVLPGERDYLLENIYKLNIVPAGRHLWATGADGVNATANCFVAPWGTKLSEHFCWVFDHLMTGSGVGANYSEMLINEFRPMLPVSKIELRVACDSWHPNHAEVVPESEVGTLTGFLPDIRHVVEDSREGWVEALRVLIDSVVKPDIRGRRLLIDVSKVRARNEPIRGFGGTASGPGPLADLLRSVASILNEAQKNGSFTPLQAMEIDHEIARCVVAGNVRRSARMACLNWNDPAIWDFLACKEDQSKHWTANISVAIDQDFLDQMHDDSTEAGKIHTKVVENMIKNGEPGYLNLALANATKDGGPPVWATNPCGEQFLEQGSACALAHVNLAAISSLSVADQRLAFIAMSRFALRSLDRDYLDDIEMKATYDYRRIGVGFFGLQEFAAMRGVRYSDIPQSAVIGSLMRGFYQAVRGSADHLADELGWSRPRAVTTIAPTGSIATLAGKSTGCEPILYSYYNRLVRFAENDAALQGHIEAGLKTEPCIYSDNTTVVYFPTRDSILDSVDPDIVECSGDITIEDHLAVQAFLQETYVDNAISKTLGVKPGVSAEELSKLITIWLPRLKGLTVFPDLSRDQAPFQPITQAEYEASANQSTGGYLERDCGPLGCPIR